MMPRYFTVRARGWCEDDLLSEPMRPDSPSVPEHIATHTGLIDINGDVIMRAPNPMGFVWSDQ